MKLSIRIFSILDFLSLVFLGMQLYYIISNYDRIQQLSEKVQSGLMFPMFVLILIGAILQWRLKMVSFILYYIQFPFRLYLWIFTVGFITLIPEQLGYFGDFWFNILFKACFVVEVIRLFFTITFHRRLNKTQV